VSQVLRIACGADHAGVDLKNELAALLRAQGLVVDDLGTSDHSSCDYPDFAHAVARAIETGAADRGLLVCGTGIGMAISANRHAGVRAVVGTDLFSLALARQHNDANCLTLGARVTASAHAAALLECFLTTPFEGGRHQRRVDKMSV
jgi:ribose 5-phosphate isomerase B